MSVISLILLLSAVQTPGVVVDPVEVDSRPVIRSAEDKTRGKELQTLEEPHSTNGLSVDHRIFDFGLVYSQNPLTHHFTLTNTSEREIQIIEIKSDCGCTASILDTDVLKPGESATLKTVMTPELLEGKVNKNITVTSDLPGPRNWLEISLRAEFASVLRLEPAHLYFKNVNFGESATENVVIHPVAGSEIQVTGVEVIEGNLDLSLTPVYADSDLETAESGSIPKSSKVVRWNLSLKLPENTPAGKVHALVKIKSDSDLQPEISFPVYGIVRSQVSVVPTQCYFGTLNPGETKEKSIRIEKTGDPTLDTPTIQCEIPNLECAIETKEPGRLYILKVSLHVPINHQGRLSGELIVLTNDPAQQEIRLPVFGYTPAVRIENSEDSDGVKL
ncbi:DUF1573 domain-containing protein [bacterium]|nr:DUF1573 domain-containing protein [candidate division CSSED10-310 bacterium]